MCTRLFDLDCLPYIFVGLLIFHFCLQSSHGGIFNRGHEMHCDDILPCPKCRKIDTANYVPVMYESETKWRRMCMACGYSGKAHTTTEQADEEWAREYDYNVMMERIEKKKQKALENLEREYPQFKI